MENSNLTLIGHFKGLGSREDFTILEDMTADDQDDDGVQNDQKL